MLGIYTPADSIYLLIEGVWGRGFGGGREGSDIYIYIYFILQNVWERYQYLNCFGCGLYQSMYQITM
jgi:hypothetical protein